MMQILARDSNWELQRHWSLCKLRDKDETYPSDEVKYCEGISKLFNHFSELIVEYSLRAQHSRHDRWSLHTE